MSTADNAREAGRGERPAGGVEARGQSPTVKVWDPAVRLFHWSLVGAFALAYATADEWDSIHEAAGYAVAGLLAFRILWGLVGTRHARFSDFIYRPSTVIGYIADMARRRARRYLGHNPAGGAMVVALLIALVLTTASGIAMTQDGYGELKDLHEVVSNLTLALVFLHIAGVVVSSFETRENLVRAMVTGRKRCGP